ncbi:dUTP diphosphatase [Bacillus subtilis]|uniref:dUTP diphosphatase n=1 Tax=Bacillus subtilis TaxID=1423 RepID=UPI000E2E935B|nr:dUTP diphosphatase [Bacillus subtilis]WIT27498.1 hypothetical protein [Bacillus phage SPbetaL4]
MNLQKMFEMQKALDERIIKEKGLEGQDLLPNLILALQVELAECANEWRGFKHWSNDREPRICVIDKKGQNAKEYYKNPLLEEYVDCLHFILSIGNRIGYSNKNTKKLEGGTLRSNLDVADQVGVFSDVFEAIAMVNEDISLSRLGPKASYAILFRRFNSLGKMLGFTPEQIEAAYMDKNAVNHQRQQEGY